jgi:predicted enzyme related to lactoylglutathione lyase
MNLGAARIFVRDIAEAKSFYTQRLGLTVEVADEEHGFCMFDTGTTKLIVEAIGGEDDEGRALVGRLTGLSFPVEEFTGTPEQQYWGGWLATFKDPAGNRLQLVQQPAQQIAARDVRNARA